jgi:CRISPR-associated protein Cas1
MRGRSSGLLSEKKNLKAILHSKRANIYYLEYCRVLVNGGRVEYLTQDKNKQSYWNIPIANTTVLLLGTGTSVTQAAVRLLVSAGVMIGFCGGGGTPLFAGNEIEWLTPQSEYRPTEYVQNWLSFWFEEDKRLAAAKLLQIQRLNNLVEIWEKEPLFIEYSIFPDDMAMEKTINRALGDINSAGTVQTLLEIEGRMTRALYGYVARTLKLENFKREKSGGDKENNFLNHGNYLAYGLAASTLWVMGIPHGFALMHGKTRRGALVFDVADLVKDAVVLPSAFICANKGMREQEFREMLIELMLKHKAMDRMIDAIKKTCLEFGSKAP